jgi:alpha-amylase
MKKELFFSLLLYSTLSLSAGTLMQGFYWGVPNGLWYTLDTQLPDIKKSGITALWVPPPYKGDAGASSMGYDPYDLYDFGEYNQRGTVATRFGTKKEFQKLINDAHNLGIQVYMDTVLNHMDGGSPDTYKGQTVYTTFKYPHHKWERSKQDFDLDQKMKNTYPWCYAFGTKVDYDTKYNHDELMKWNNFVVDNYHIDGFRFDVGYCIPDNVIVDFMNQRNDKFAVAEIWDSNISYLRSFIPRYEGKVHIFDFNLFYTLKDMTYGNGYFDMRRLVNAGLVGVEPRYTVTFVDNHDLNRESPMNEKEKPLAYAYILTGDGYPTIFYKDWLNPDIRKELDYLIPFHNEHAHGPINVLYSNEDIYSIARDDFIFILNDNKATGKDIGNVQTPFKSAKLVNERDNITVYTNKDGYVINYKLWSPANGYSIWKVTN